MLRSDGHATHTSFTTFLDSEAKGMHVTNRHGVREPVDLQRILDVAVSCCRDLLYVDPLRVATRTISGLYDGVSTRELDELSISVASSLIAEDPNYARVAARLLMRTTQKELELQGITSFSQSIDAAYEHGLVDKHVRTFVRKHADALNALIDPLADHRFEYFGVRTLTSRYLLKHPTKRKPLETVQFFLLRVACGTAETFEDAAQVYRMYADHRYLSATPTLLNSGTKRAQLSSCFLMDSPSDSLESIYDSYKDIALLSKYSGGIGIGFSRVRSRGSLIKGTNGHSNGIVPWLKTLDSSVAAVDQCFAPDTILFTNKGPKPISEVAVGDRVLADSGAYRRVTQIFSYRQEEPMVELDVKHSVRPTRVTDGHPFYAIRNAPMMQGNARTMAQIESGNLSPEWTKSGSLRKGDYIAQVIPTALDPVEGFTEDDARMYGIMLGDGWCETSHHSWGVAGGTESQTHMRFVRKYLAARNIHYWVTNHGGSPQYHWSATHGAVRDEATGQIMPREHGTPTLPFTHEDLYLDGQKHIAPRLMHLPRPQILKLIQGLLETDGCVSRGKEIFFTSASIPLAEGLRYQLLRLGVPCAGQYRVREMNHMGTRRDGSEARFQGTSTSIDLRIPAVPEIAKFMKVPALTTQNWLTFQGCVWSRLKSTKKVDPSNVVYDLKVQTDETYMTASALVHNGGSRKGACTVYLEPWHADVLDFLELRNNTGDEARRVHTINLAMWVSDLFMKRVEAGGTWSLFDPADVPELVDLWGDAFVVAYEAAEAKGLAKKTMPAQDLYARMMRTLAETGQGWMCFKDRMNEASNQTLKPENVIHLSNLCTEISEVCKTQEEVAVCNLASINLARHLDGSRFDFAMLADTVRTAVRQLDRVIDRNFYTIRDTKTSNMKWRPVGLGIMGLQDLFFQLHLPFDSARAKELSTEIQACIYYVALQTSMELAREYGKCAAFEETRLSQGVFHFERFGKKAPTAPSDSKLTYDWEQLRADIIQHGTRNSLLIAIAPTATIASILGVYECTEPQVSNLFKRETMSGDFLQVNQYLVRDLQARGLWSQETQEAILLADGSIQGITALPEEVRTLYRTVWEVPAKTLIDLAAARTPFIDQSQSLNLFAESPNIGRLSKMYMDAWKKRIKTTYYLRSRPAKGIAKTTVSAPVKEASTDQAAVFCSLENPEACEACQ